MATRLFACAAILASAFALPTERIQHQKTYKSLHERIPAPLPRGGENADRYFSPAYIPHGHDLKPALTHEQTNGKSLLGQLDSPRLPEYLPHNSGHEYPWGDRTAEFTDMYRDLPNTGVTRYYNFTVSYVNIAPDGVQRPGLVINGAFPGPTIEANWGDWIQVTVHNALPNEGTSIHWHGLLQKNTSYMDGVPAVTQCPIAPGDSYVYRFRADLYGTTWYHSHYSAQYAGGALGALIIYGPHDNIHYDVDLGPVMIGDWYHNSYYDLVEQTMAPISAGLPPPLSQNSLINGKMNYPCADAGNNSCTPNAGISKFQVQSGKSYRLRLVNVGAEGLQKFSIDGYNLTVFANDFVPIQPYTTNVVTLGIGQRSDVILHATGKTGDAVWMRANLGTSAFSGGCTLNDGTSPEGVAAIYYQGSNTTKVPTTNSTVTQAQTETCTNDPLNLTIPFYKSPQVQNAQVQTLNIQFASNGTNELFFINNSTFRADYNNPVLLQAHQGLTQSQYASDANVYDFGNAPAIQLIVYNYAATGAHPMHMHGHNYQVLAVGTGTWNGVVTRPSNPQRRDVQLLPVAQSSTVPGYIVVSIQADNPGTWPFHCHIAWHVSAGLYVNILENAQALINDNTLAPAIQPTCSNWAKWTSKDTPDEIDSGL